MATERLTMSRTREILRQRWALGQTVRETSRGVVASLGVVSKTERRARAAGLDWAAVEALDDEKLERRLYGERSAPGVHDAERARPDPLYMHTELRRKGVTLELLHLEYLERHPSGYRYTAFCEVYRKWLSLQRLSMRQVHRAGDKCFVDYSGKRPHIIDRETGEVIEVELFVAVLGASSYTYAEATRTQRVHDFLASHVRALEYFGGAPRIMVPDQLKSAVRVACRYEPVVQKSYADLGRHYGTALMPARPRKPKDKAKVEVAVQVVQRWILARLRNETFFSLEALNARIWELLEDLNARPMKHIGGASRRELFERLEQGALRPLPAERFVVGEWKVAAVSPDYHVQLGHHYYSVPYGLRGEDVDARLTAATIEVFFKGKRVASHMRDDAPHRYTTVKEHMPEAHRRHYDGIDSVLSWGASVGPMTAAMVERIIERSPVREQGWRSAMGLRRVAEKYGHERTELACERALFFGARSYKPVERLLALGRETAPLPDQGDANDARVLAHENVRGPDYFY